MNNKIKSALIYILYLAIVSCSKQNEFLDAAPSSTLIIPKTLDDVTLLLHNESVFNTQQPSLAGVLSADEYYVQTAAYNTASVLEKNSYIWAKTMYPNMTVNDWNSPYGMVYYANTIIETLSKIPVNGSNQVTYNVSKGSALFFRSLAFFELLQTFAPVYNSSTAESDLGIPIRLTSNVNVKSIRASVKDSYSQVTKDLNSAITLLPDISAYLTSPTKRAANGLLARVYLTMSDFSDAFSAANAALNINDSLTDFNNFIPTSNALTARSQFPLNEILYLTTLSNYGLSSNPKQIVDSNLYNSYDSTDLRKTFFFQNVGGQYRFTGSYANSTPSFKFSGVANDELYLIRAECAARNGDKDAALSNLNRLLIKRYKTGTYTPILANSATDALNQILIERKKELVCRGIRWSDLRRLNQESAYQTTLYRIINGTQYSLEPNSPNYTLSIPDNEILLSGLQQNIRQ